MVVRSGKKSQQKNLTSHQNIRTWKWKLQNVTLISVIIGELRMTKMNTDTHTHTKNDLVNIR